MKTNLILSSPAQLETECLVVVVVDKSEKTADKNAKPDLSLESTEAAVKSAAAHVLVFDPARDFHVSHLWGRQVAQ